MRISKEENAKRNAIFMGLYLWAMKRLSSVKSDRPVSMSIYNLTNEELDEIWGKYLAEQTYVNGGLVWGKLPHKPFSQYLNELLYLQSLSNLDK